MFADEEGKRDTKRSNTDICEYLRHLRIKFDFYGNTLPLLSEKEFAALVVPINIILPVDAVTLARVSNLPTIESYSARR
jgi:hypothetical protein